MFSCYFFCLISLFEVSVTAAGMFLTIHLVDYLTLTQKQSSLTNRECALFSKRALCPFLAKRRQFKNNNMNTIKLNGNGNHFVNIGLSKSITSIFFSFYFAFL